MPKAPTSGVPEEDYLLTTSQVAEILGQSVGTLQNWRSNRRGEGPPYVHIGQRVRYRHSDVQGWIKGLEHAA